MVIARIWRGWTTPENADAYQQVVSQEVLPGIAAHNLHGYHDAYRLLHPFHPPVRLAPAGPDEAVPGAPRAALACWKVGERNSWGVSLMTCSRFTFLGVTHGPSS